MSMTPEEINRYSQQLKLNEIGFDGQIKLKNARVLCIGAGGLGSSLLMYLAAAGIGTLGIVDDDLVECSNLQRQVLYQTAHIGNKKVLMAKQQLLALNPHITIHTYSEMFHLGNAHELIHQYDIVADCSDNFATRYLLNDICFYLNKPLMIASIFQYQGQCSFFLGDKSSCFRCLFPTIAMFNHDADCNQAGVLGVLPGMLGIIQASEIIKWILNIGEILAGRLLIVDLATMNFQQFYLTKNPECLLCVSRLPIEALPRPAPSHEFNPYAISPHEVKLKLAAKEELFLVDVRSMDEHCQNNLGGLLIPLPELPQRFTELNADKPIIIYCQSGKRSMHAVKLLLDKNFKYVKYLKGGLTAWQND